MGLAELEASVRGQIRFRRCGVVLAGFDVAASTLPIDVVDLAGTTAQREHSRAVGLDHEQEHVGAADILPSVQKGELWCGGEDGQQIHEVVTAVAFLGLASDGQMLRPVPGRRPVRPSRCRTDGTVVGASIWMTRSRSPTSIPSSNVEVDTMTQSRASANACPRGVAPLPTGTSANVALVILEARWRGESQGPD